MIEEQRKEIRYLIAFYDLHNWDWSNVVEYLCYTANSKD